MPIALRQKGRVDAALLHYNAISCISAARLPAEKFDGAVSYSFISSGCLKIYVVRGLRRGDLVNDSKNG
jgi:hypothetical protein